MTAGSLARAPSAEQGEARGYRLRRASPADGLAIHALKQSLRFGRADGVGGFLLGSSQEHYTELARAGLILLLEAPSRPLAGFAITIPDSFLRSSDLWTRRQHITWTGGVAPFAESARVAYFDQLAAAPPAEGRALIPALALAAVLDLVVSGHEHVLATVVREPVHNTAALRLLHAIGARRVGQLDESYPGVGRLLSDLYHLDVSVSSAHRWETTPLGRRIRRLAAALSHLDQSGAAATPGRERPPW